MDPLETFLGMVRQSLPIPRHAPNKEGFKQGNIFWAQKKKDRKRDTRRKNGIHQTRARTQKKAALGMSRKAY